MSDRVARRVRRSFPSQSSKTRRARRVGLLAAVGFVFASASLSAADIVPIEAFARFNKLTDPRLSPDGVHLSLTSDLGDGHYALHILRLADQQQTALLRLPRYEMPLTVEWVGDHRLVLSKGRKWGSLEAPIPLGEIIATDADGEKQTYVYGYQQSTRTRGIDRGFGVIEGLPQTPNGHFYMRAYAGESRRSLLYDVDTVRTTHKLIADVGEPHLGFALRRDGSAAYAFGTDDDDNYLLFRNDGGDTWTPVTQSSLGGQWWPFAFSSDGTQLFGYFSSDGEPLSVVRSDAAGQGRTVLAQDAFANAGRLLWSAPPTQPFAAYSTSGIPRPTYFDEAGEETLRHRALRQALPGLQVDYVDHTTDGGKSLLFAHSDRNPGAWYLFERGNRKLSKLLDLQAAIPPERMGERQPFRFSASDGVELDGYMTIPHGADPSKLPTVLMPHGGPHADGDRWAFDNDAQFLASRGYLVLQVNFRGSTGRGRRFETAGYMQWGGRIQDDLLDGLRWSIAQGHSDPARICTYGASFGAYSAMMIVAKAPDLVRCAVGFAGIYDLALMHTKGDIRSDRSGRNYLARVIGRDPAQLAADSPVSHAGDIRAAVLLIHGEDDERAPFAHAKAMRAALSAAGREPEWMAVPKEGHGFYNEDNTIAMYRRIEAFIGAQIGGAMPDAATAQE